uniref:MYND-type domain-containing protein n=1 Tax=Amphiprion percula TaxID=161767 RepID=A0A3P8T7D4_AMPPE
MLSTTCEGVAAAAWQGGPEPGTGSHRHGHGGASAGEERRQGLGVQKWPDGSRYEGEFVDGLKHGKGRYTWINGEYYEGSFYKDYKHGAGLYCWPTGHKFIGKFYLNRKEGYGQQGLYRTDQRFGPGVVSYPDGQQDVGLWLGEHLLRFCTPVEEGFSLKNFPEYRVATKTPICNSHLQPDRGLLANENAILPSGMESYSTDGDHLPLPPGRRRELDQHFYGELWEPDAHPYQGYERDPLSTFLQAENVGWDVAAILSMNRENFGPKGPLEVHSELLIQHASRGELQAVSQILRTGLVHPDVADSQKHTALIAATVNCHNDVIHLLLDMGADIDMLTCEGMSALAVCHVLYYPFKSLNTTLVDPPAKTPVRLCLILFVELCIRSVDSELITELHTVYSAQRSHLVSGLISCFICLLQGKDKDLAPKQSFDSACSLSSYNIRVTEEVMQRSAEALSRTGFPQCSDTQGTVRKMAALKIEHRVRLNTLKLLLERGADPNAARVPLLVLFLAIMAADTEAVRRLLLCGARTDIPLPPEKKGLYPLHVAAALPGPAGPRITELLLHTVPDPDTRACDQDEIYEPDRCFLQICMKTEEPLSFSESPHLKEGGRTALHVACQRDSDYLNASKVVALLVSHSASTELLWSGHSPLSLAIASGNELAVEELLKGGADPSIPLGCRVGSALCALANINYYLGGNRIQLDLRIAKTPFHVLNMREREIFKARRQLLSKMGDLLRRAAGQREKEHLEREEHLTLNSKTKSVYFISFTFCYHCGRSVSVKLSACSRCNKVFYCSRTCKLKAWDQGHKEECIRVSGGNRAVSFQQLQSSKPKQHQPRNLTQQAPKLRPKYR